MTESRPGEDVAARMERDADELEHHLNKLEDHISDAEKAAQARREEAMPGEAVAGDWEETRGAPGQGEDPEGALGEHDTGDGATERDATEGEDRGDAGSGADAGDRPASGGSVALGSDDAAPASSGDGDRAGAPERDDAVGSRMPGHASGGDD